MSHKAKKTFLWKCNNPSIIFPIDLSAREGSQMLNSQVDRRALSKDVLCSFLLKETLQQLAMSDPSEDIPEDIEDKLPPVPLEAWPFLNCFDSLIRKPDYHRYFCCTGKNGKKPRKVPQDTMKQFMRDLCKALCEETKYLPSAIGQLDNTYCRHRLFQNSTFTEVILDDIWEQELLPRYNKLRLLAKQAPPDTQINVLINCLLTLDNAILSLEEDGSHTTDIAAQAEPKKPQQSLTNVAKHKDFSASKPQNPPAQMLDQILSARIRCGADTNKYATYRVNNTILSNGSYMEDAFRKLAKSKSDSSLLSQARQSYLINLAEQFDMQAQTHEDMKNSLYFELNYFRLKDYLLRPREQERKTLVPIIEEHCKQYCVKIINYCTYNPTSGSPFAPFFPKPSYHSDLLGYLIEVRMNGALSCFQESIQMIAFYNAANTALLNNQVHQGLSLKNHQLPWNLTHETVPLLDNRMENVYYRDAQNFSIYFQNAWKFLYKEEAGTLNYSIVATRLSKDGQAAAEYFDRKGLFPYSEDAVSEMLNKYRIVLSTPNQFHPPVDFLNSVSQLLMGLFLQVLKKVTEDTVPVIENFIKPHFERAASNQKA